MSNFSKWWSTWTPYWEYIEDRHMSTSITEKILEYIKPPVLIIGAGQGLIVKHLKNKGLTVDGIDIEPEMIEYAKKRHKLDLIYADAQNLPIENKKYKTVIISSGVVDYNYDDQSIKKIINEALRVTAPGGNLFVAFYQLSHRIEKIYKQIGVITLDNQYYMKRIFDIDKLSKKDPLKCIKPIMQWTGRKFLNTLFLWTYIGMTLPKEIYLERKKMEYIFKKAKEDHLDQSALYSSIPDHVPYRDSTQVKILLNKMGLFFNKITKYPDCSIVRFYQSNTMNKIAHNQQRPSIIENNLKSKDWVIKTKELCKKYKGSKINAVDYINLTIPKGTIFGLLGPNGAGKTTTLSMLSGIIRSTSGEIRFGEGINRQQLKKVIGYVPQDLALYPRLTAIENLHFFGNLYYTPAKILNQRSKELLQFVGLLDKADQIVKKFSTGMKRRLNLAIGLINDPKIILMDEPTVGIDPQSRNYIFESVLKLKKKGTTILYTTHYMEEVNRLCDYLAIMDHGRIILTGEPDRLIKEYGYHSIKFYIHKRLSRKQLESISEINSILEIDMDEKENILNISASTDISNLDTIEAINKRINNKDTYISLTKIIEPNLENLFLDITGRHLRDQLEINTASFERGY